MDSSIPPKLRDLLNQLRQAPAQIELEVLAMRCATPVATGSPTPEALVQNVPQAESELLELWQKIEQAKSELASLTKQHTDLVDDYARWEEAVSAASEQHKTLQNEVSVSALELQRLTEEHRQFDFRRQHYEQIIAEGEAVSVALTAREQAAQQREEALSGREQDISLRSKKLDATKFWLESLLPNWLNESEVSSWRDALMDDAQHPSSASTAAGLLFATLSLYTYTQRDTDTRAIADALRDLGKRLFVWLKERNVSDADASRVAQSWAAHINRDCEGRCELEVPVPGAPAHSQTMLYQPRAGVSAQSVVAVQSWCVRGAKREIIHRASVTV